MKWKYMVEIESDDDVDFSPESLKEIIENSYEAFGDETQIKVNITTGE